MKAQIISFHCLLKDKMGRVLSSTFNQDVITQVEDAGEFLQGLADGLRNLRKGEKRQICLSADRAYGFYDPSLVLVVPRKKLSRKKRFFEGQQILYPSPKGDPIIFRVTEVMGEMITLDGNHPLAGHDLVFDIEATEAREATSDELAEAMPKNAGRSYDRPLH